MRRPKHAYLVTLASALALGGCGTDDEEGGSDTGGSPSSSGSGGQSSAGASSGAGTAASEGGMSSEGGTPSDTGGSTSGGSGGSGGSSTAGNSFYLPCESAADCEMYGGGKVCCVAGPMHFCTKPSACMGEELP